MMDLKEIRDLITFYLHRTDLDAVMPQFFELARERISKDARLIAMETDLHLDFTGSPIALPVDFLEFRSVRANVTGGIRALKVATKNHLDTVQDISGRSPSFYAISGGNLEIAPGQNNGDIDLTYYARPAPLINDSDTNSVLDDWPSLYLYSVLTYANNSIQDTETEQVVQRQYELELERANESDDNARYSGDSPTMHGS